MNQTATSPRRSSTPCARRRCTTPSPGAGGSRRTRWSCTPTGTGTSPRPTRTAATWSSAAAPPCTTCRSPSPPRAGRRGRPPARPGGPRSPRHRRDPARTVRPRRRRPVPGDRPPAHRSAPHEPPPGTRGARCGHWPTQARRTGALLLPVTGTAMRHRLTATLTEAAHRQEFTPGYAGELQLWTRRYAAGRDGVPAASVAAPPTGLTGPSPLAPVPPRPARPAAAAPGHGSADDAAELLVIATVHDDPIDRLRAGEATSAVLLAATALGLATTPLSQGIEVDVTPPRDPAGCAARAGASSAHRPGGFSTRPPEPRSCRSRRGATCARS